MTSQVFHMNGYEYNQKKIQGSYIFEQRLPKLPPEKIIGFQFTLNGLEVIRIYDVGEINYGNY